MPVQPLQGRQYEPALVRRIQKHQIVRLTGPVQAVQIPGDVPPDDRRSGLQAALSYVTGYQCDGFAVVVDENDLAGSPAERLYPQRSRTGKKIEHHGFFDASGKELFRHEGFFSKADILAKWNELGIATEKEREDKRP